jgi:hypothetical protein
MPFNFGAQVPARLNELMIRTIEYGASSGIAQLKIFPRPLKAFAVRVYVRRTGKRPAGIQTWARTTFLHFWMGDYDELVVALEKKLSSDSKIRSRDLDFIIRLTWHAVTNVGITVTDAMQRGFENHLKQRAGSRNEVPIGAQAQWFSARSISGGMPIDWEPAAEVISIASHANDADFA